MIQAVTVLKTSKCLSCNMEYRIYDIGNILLMISFISMEDNDLSYTSKIKNFEIFSK